MEDWYDISVLNTLDSQISSEPDECFPTSGQGGAQKFGETNLLEELSKIRTLICDSLSHDQLAVLRVELCSTATE